MFKFKSCTCANTLPPYFNCAWANVNAPWFNVGSDGAVPNVVAGASSLPYVADNEQSTVAPIDVVIPNDDATHPFNVLTISVPELSPALKPTSTWNDLGCLLIPFDACG